MAGHPLPAGALDRRPAPERPLKRFVLGISESIIAQGLLKLPGKFVREYRDELSDTVKLCVADGQVWQVELIKGSIHLYFDGDWQKFFRYYSISDESFLLFKYKGKFKGISNFSLHIFNKSLCEIPYQIEESIDIDNGVEIPGKRKRFHAMDQVDIEDDDDDDALEHLRSSTPRKTGTPLPKKRQVNPNVDSVGHQGFKKQRPHGSSDPKHNTGCRDDENERRRENNKVKREVDDLDPDDDDVNNCTRANLNGKNEALPELFLPFRLPSIIARSSPETKSAMRKAKKFKRKYYSFLILVQRINFDSDVLNVPTPFFRMCLSNPPKRFQIRGSDGKVWDACFELGRNGRLRITSGWARFRSDNFLKLGDVCLFELIPSTAGTCLRSHIFPASSE